jgi:hypothetical protein
MFKHCLCLLALFPWTACNSDDDELGSDYGDHADLGRVLECTASAPAACRCYCERWDDARALESASGCWDFAGVGAELPPTMQGSGQGEGSAAVGAPASCFTTVDTCTSWCVQVADAALDSAGGSRCRAAMLQFRACMGSYPVHVFRTWLVEETWSGCAEKVDAFRTECGTAGFGVDDIELCRDGLDNDSDGVADCADCDCALDALCVRAGSQCTPGSQTVTVIPQPTSDSGMVPSNGSGGDEQGLDATEASGDADVSRDEDGSGTSDPLDDADVQEENVDDDADVELDEEEDVDETTPEDDGSGESDGSGDEVIIDTDAGDGSGE